MSTANLTGLPGIASGITYLSECTADLCSLDYAVLRYVPNDSANIVLMSIFSSLLLIQIVSWIFFKTHAYTSAMSCGLILEILGYWARVNMHFDLFDTVPFYINTLCLTMAPIFFTAALQLTFSHLITHYGPHNHRLSPEVHTICFMTANAHVLILQIVGGALVTTSPSLDSLTVKQGQYVTVAGLSLQIFSLVCFILLSAEFLWNVRRDRQSKWCNEKMEQPAPNTKGLGNFPFALATVTLFLFTRIIFRIAETAQGFRSPIANDEVAFMILEGGMILLAAILITIFHPGWYFSAIKLEENEKEGNDEEDGHEDDVYMRPWCTDI